MYHCQGNCHSSCYAHRVFTLLSRKHSTHQSAKLSGFTLISLALPRMCVLIALTQPYIGTSRALMRPSILPWWRNSPNKESTTTYLPYIWSVCGKLAVLIIFMYRASTT
ncbi:hypothetical protein BDR04DRAFT_595965 [Suillus decipiens]|nr:hypothetical protein BDR04DRAFT_595965 [Suillus decipiens]